MDNETSSSTGLIIFHHFVMYFECKNITLQLIRDTLFPL
jgi:hypothetical protein